MVILGHWSEFGLKRGSVLRLVAVIALLAASCTKAPPSVEKTGGRKSSPIPITEPAAILLAHEDRDGDDEALSPAGDLAATIDGDSDSYGNRLRIWDVDRNIELQSIPVDAIHYRGPITFSEDGGLIATTSAGGEKVGIWETHTGTPLGEITGPNIPPVMAFSPLADQLAIADFDVAVYPLVEGTGPVLLKSESVAGESEIQQVRFRQDNSTVVVSGTGGIEVWDVTNEPTLVFSTPCQCAYELAPALDYYGERAAIALADGMIEIWDLVTNQRQSELEVAEGQVYSLALAGPVLAISTETGGLGLWNLAEERKTATIPLQGREPGDLHLDREGRRLLTGHVEGRAVWDVG